MDTFFMDTVFDSSLALPAIIVPLGVAYVILLWQARNLNHDRRKEPATTHDESQQEKAELSRAEKKQASRLMMYWLF